MNKIKENILVGLIFTIVFTVSITAFEFFRYDRIAIEKNIIGGVIVSILILLDKRYKFSDKVVRMLTFIK
jgi:hypothetical protein